MWRCFNVTQRQRKLRGTVPLSSACPALGGYTGATNVLRNATEPLVYPGPVREYPRRADATSLFAQAIHDREKERERE